MFEVTFQNQNPKSVNEVLKLRDELLKSGIIAELTEELKKAPKEKKADLGRKLENLKNSLKSIADDWIQSIQLHAEKTEQIEFFDPTFVASIPTLHTKKLHPVTQITKELVEIYKSLGFEVAEGPLVESQWYNFTALNIPAYHPARGLQDTFFLNQKDDKGEHLVLRTQTSDVQIRFMEQQQPPIRIVVPGLVYRNEDIDATHDMQFHQLEGLVIDKEVSIANLKFFLQETFNKLFGDDSLEIRLRPSYFPFVSPGYEIDLQCLFCKGSGCKVCKSTGWIECVGGGLVHPQVLKNAGLDPEKWQGLAFGFGVDRLAQMKLGITGLSQFYNSNLSFLES
jgi:phenylalanyl-tRNA synthetase alpha chain